jgi:hypothetical protein
MSESRTATGEVIHIGETESFGSGDFTKRLLVIETEQDTDYPQQIPFEFKKERGDQLDKYEVGQVVTVSFNLEGRAGTGKYDGRWFGSNTGWRVESETTAAPKPAAGVVDDDNLELGDTDSQPF